MITVDGTPIDPNQRPFLVAEVGINAYNDLDLAYAFIDVAAKAGAEAVKFQTHIADEEMAKEEMARVGVSDVYDTVSHSEWSYEDHEALQIRCREQGVTFLSTPFSVAGIELLDDLGVPAIKIGSGELTNFELLDRAAETAKPLIVSTGMSELDTVKTTYNFLSERTDEFVFLYCVSAYPTEPEDLNLDVIDTLRNEFDVPIGFSDHSIGIEAPVLALGHDIAMIEKHFTIDRRLPGPDQAVSLEPEEFERLVEFVDYDKRTSGTEKSLTKEENDVKTWARHSLVAADEIQKGDEFTHENLTTKRPGTGIPASKYFDVLGTVASRGLTANEVLHYEDVDT